MKNYIGPTTPRSSSSRMEPQQYMTEAEVDRTLVRGRNLDSQNRSKFNHLHVSRSETNKIGKASKRGSKPRQKTEKAKKMVEDVEEAVIIEEVSVRLSAAPAPVIRKRYYQEEVAELLAAEAEQSTKNEKVDDDDSVCETTAGVVSSMSRALANQAKAFRNAKDKLGRCSNDAHYHVSDDKMSIRRDSPATTRTESPLSHIEDENEIIIEEFVVNVAESLCSFMLCEDLFYNCCCSKKKNGEKYYDDDETCFTAATGYSTVASVEEVLL